MLKWSPNQLKWTLMINKTSQTLNTWLPPIIFTPQHIIPPHHTTPHHIIPPHHTIPQQTAHHTTSNVLHNTQRTAYSTHTAYSTYTPQHTAHSTPHSRSHHTAHTQHTAHSTHTAAALWDMTCKLSHLSWDAISELLYFPAVKLNSSTLTLTLTLTSPPSDPRNLTLNYHSESGPQ
jgi:hypothetical protein